MGILEKFKIGLNKSASSFSSGIKNLVIKKKIDEKTLNLLEEFLIKSDVGVDVASDIKKIISEKKILPNQDSIMQVNQILLNYIEELMHPLEKEIFNKKNMNNGKVIFIFEKKNILFIWALHQSPVQPFFIFNNLCKFFFLLNFFQFK